MATNIGLPNHATSHHVTYFCGVLLNQLCIVYKLTNQKQFLSSVGEIRTVINRILLVENTLIEWCAAIGGHIPDVTSHFMYCFFSILELLLKMNVITMSIFNCILKFGSTYKTPCNTGLKVGQNENN